MVPIVLFSCCLLDYSLAHLFTCTESHWASNIIFVLTNFLSWSKPFGQMSMFELSTRIVLVLKPHFIYCNSECSYIATLDCLLTCSSTFFMQISNYIIMFTCLGDFKPGFRFI